MHQTFMELGISSSVAKDMPSSANATVITFQTHDQQIVLPQHYISYNFEQLTTKKKWHPDLWKRFK